jgi:predicted permease
MAIRILSIVFPLFAIAALGYVVGRRWRPDLMDTNRLNMDVFVPALVFAALATKDFRIVDCGPLALGAVLVVVGSGVLAWILARTLGLEARTLVPPMMFNNSGNLGLPLAILAFGEQARAPAAVLFAVSNFLQFSYGAWLLDRTTRIGNIWRIPSVFATALGLVVSGTGGPLWLPLLQAIRMVGDVAIPVTLLSLGVRLANTPLQSWRIGFFGALARPVAGLLVAWTCLPLLELPVEQRALLLVFAALPCRSELRLRGALRPGTGPGRLDRSDRQFGLRFRSPRRADLCIAMMQNRSPPTKDTGARRILVAAEAAANLLEERK